MTGHAKPLNDSYERYWKSRNRARSYHRNWTVKTIVRQNAGGVADKMVPISIGGLFLYGRGNNTITILNNTTVR